MSTSHATTPSATPFDWSDHAVSRRVVKALMLELHRIATGRNSGPRPGLRFEAASARRAPGLVPGTALRQAAAFVRLVRVEIDRSQAVRQLLALITLGGGRPMTLAFGRHSCAFVAAPDGDEFDMDDLAAVPGGRAVDAGAMLTRTDLLLHILEDRLGRLNDRPTRGPGLTWQIQPGRYAANYRTEQGRPGSLDRLELRAGPGMGPSRRGVMIATDSDGNRTTIGPLRIGKHRSRIQRVRPTVLSVRHDWQPLWPRARAC